MNNQPAITVTVNTIVLAATLFINYVGGAGAFGFASVGEISNRYPSLFTPAGYAFSIWSVIFLQSILFVGFQWFQLGKGHTQWIERTAWWFALANAANSLWVMCWLQQWMGASVIVICCLLLFLSILAVRLRLALDDEPVRIIFFVWWPIAVYLGWLMVATIACMAAWLVSLGPPNLGLPGPFWVNIMIAVATLLYLYLLRTRNLRESAAVGIWAFVAIAVKQWNSYPAIGFFALGAAAVLFIAISAHGWRNRYFSPVAKLKRGQW